MVERDVEQTNAKRNTEQGNIDYWFVLYTDIEQTKAEKLCFVHIELKSLIWI